MRQMKRISDQNAARVLLAVRNELRGRQPRGRGGNNDIGTGPGIHIRKDVLFELEIFGCILQVCYSQVLKRATGLYHTSCMTSTWPKKVIQTRTDKRVIG